MGKQCFFCGKKRQTGISLSHSHHRTRRFFEVNLQSVRTASGRRLVCTGCLKSGKVVKAAARAKPKSPAAGS